MLQKSIIAAVICAVSVAACAQDGVIKTLEKQFVVYKWKEGGKTRYAKRPSRGVTDFTMLNEYGMEIRKDRPYSNGKDSNVIRPVRVTPEDLTGESNNAAVDPNAPSTSEVPGTITRQQRCDTAKKNLSMMNTKTVVYEDDGRGNLVPLSKDAVQTRKKEAEESIKSLCD